MAQLTFYFDRNFGKRFPQALDRAKPPFKVEYHHNKTNNFPMRMPDDEWLAIVCKKGWVVFSHDQKFHAIEAEAMAIKQHNGMCFYLPGAQEDVWKKLGYIVKAAEKIAAIIAAIVTLTKHLISYNLEFIGERCFSDDRPHQPHFPRPRGRPRMA